MIEFSPLSSAEYLLIVVWFVVSYVSMAIGPPGGIKSAAAASIMPPSVAIPIQAAVEAISGIHRLWLLRPFVDWRFLLSFVISGTVGFGIGFAARFVAEPPDDVLRIVMGLSILLTAWLPVAKLIASYKGFPWLVGALTSFISLFTGGIAPFIKAAIDNKYDDQKQIVATLTGSILYQSSVKLVLFGLFGFSFGAYAVLMAGLLLAGFAGTWLGRKLLFSVSKTLIKRLSKALVTLSALYLLFQGLLPFYQALGWPTPVLETIASAEAKPVLPDLRKLERKLAQLALADLGYALGAADGEFNEATELALAKWQLRQGRTGTGRFASRAELVELLDQADMKLNVAEQLVSDQPVATDIAIEPTANPPTETHQPLETFRDCNDCPEMVMLPAGDFLMGSSSSEQGRSEHEDPQHQVILRKAFALGKFEVTFEEYDDFVERTGRLKPNDLGWGRGRRPVIFVDHDDASAYCSWLGDMTSNAYRLPSEAEWEYAARAGTETAFAFGDKLMPEEANFGSHVGMTVEVGRYPANDWGLHDMHGNVREWVEDHWHRSYEGAPSDGRSRRDTSAENRVLRGGSWASPPGDLRAAHRNSARSVTGNVGIGFRCARLQS